MDSLGAAAHKLRTWARVFAISYTTYNDAVFSPPSCFPAPRPHPMSCYIVPPVEKKLKGKHLAAIVPRLFEALMYAIEAPVIAAFKDCISCESSPGHIDVNDASCSQTIDAAATAFGTME